jgi:hypothetical protein
LLSYDIDVSGAGAPEGADARAGGEEQLEHGASPDQEEAGRAGQSEGTYSIYFLKSSVADPDPNPDPSVPFLGLLDPDTLVRGMDPDPSPDLDPSIIKQKQ